MQNVCGQDVFGRSLAPLTEKALFLLDMDGTIYNEDTLFDDTKPFLQKLRDTGRRYVFITNNSSKSVTAYIDKLARMGVASDKEDFYTSAQATIAYLKKNHPGKVVYCQGTHSLVEELRSAGLTVATEVCEEAGVILVGFDTELTSEKLRNTCIMLKRDLPYLATNPDLACPVSFGFIPDCGAMCGMLKCATGKMPQFIGKPEPTMLELVAAKYGVEKSACAIVGDRLYTDIAAGGRAGVTSICVLTGEATLNDIETGEIKPDYTLPGIGALTQLL